MENKNIFVLLIISVLICHFIKDLEFSYYPDSAKKALSVKIEMEGAGPEEMEEQLCDPLEREILMMPGIRNISSSSKWESCEIRIFLDDQSDINRFYIELRELIDRLSPSFPPSAGKAVIRKNSSLNSPIFLFIPELMKQDENHELPRWTEEKIRSELRGVSGISQLHVSSSSGQDINIKFDKEMLTSFRMNTMDLAAAVHKQNKISVYGLADSSEIILDQRLLSVPEFLNIPLSSALSLSDLSDISIGNQDSDSISRLNGERQVMVWIYENGDANTITLCKQLREVAAEFPESLVLYDEGKLIEDALKEIFIILFLSILAVILITILIIKDFRSAIAVCLNIPFSISGTLAIFNMTSLEINILVLSALALCSGMLIDNGIIVLEQGFEASKKALFSSLFSTLLVLSPFLFASPELKKLCSPLIISLSICLSLSLLFIILTMKNCPGRYLEQQHSESGNKIRAVSHFITRFRSTAFFLLIIITIPALLLLGKLDYIQDFSLINDSIRFSIEFPAGSTKELIEIKLQDMEKRLALIDDIEFYSSEYKDEKASFTIKISKNTDRNMLEKEIEKTMTALPGFLHFDNNSSEDSYHLRVICHDLTLLYSETERLAQFLQKKLNRQPLILHYKKQQPILRIQTDNNFCMMTGMTPMTIAQEVSCHLAPPVLGKWFPGNGSIYDIRIFNNEIEKMEMANIGKLKPSGNSDLLLEDMTLFTDKEDYGPIEHHNSQRSTSFSVSSKGMGNTRIHKIIHKSLEHYTLPESVRVIHGEQYSLYKQNAAELIKLLAASLLLLFLLLVFIFESLFLPFFMTGQIIFCHIFTLAFLSIAKVDLSIPIFFALILNTGLTINNSLIVYSQFKSGRPSLTAALRSLIQCRTTILTAAITTLTGFIPFVIAQESSADLLKALSFTVGSAVIISISILYSSLFCLDTKCFSRRSNSKSHILF